MMRMKLVFVALCLVFVAALYSCAGDDGATGPTGPEGNANVMLFEFGSRTVSTSIMYPFEVPAELFKNSLVLAYYNPEVLTDTTAYYPVPGLGPYSNYMTRSYYWTVSSDADQQYYLVELKVPGGTTNYTTPTVFRKFKIFVIPASAITVATSRGLLDLSDYHAVVDYLKLSE